MSIQEKYGIKLIVASAGKAIFAMDLENIVPDPNDESFNPESDAFMNFLADETLEITNCIQDLIIEKDKSITSDTLEGLLVMLDMLFTNSSHRIDFVENEGIEQIYHPDLFVFSFTLE